MRIAIVGGGPGGLFSANHLNDVLGGEVEITVFEADRRLGGKIRTERFGAAGPLFEAGVAELYDYSAYAVDPLKELITDKLGLPIVPMHGPSVMLGATVVPDFDHLAGTLGAETARAVAAFYRTCETLYSPSAYYDGHPDDDNKHPWANVTFKSVLDAIPDARARRYIETAVHTDVAAEPHRTSALNGLKNVIMEDPRYMGVYSIAGGIEQLVDGLAVRVPMTVRLEHRVRNVSRRTDGYTLSIDTPGGPITHETDYLIIALPDSALCEIRFLDAPLADTIARHLAHHDHPAHYLRVTGRFKTPAWRGVCQGTYAMSDALGGCCVYDDSARYASSDDTHVLSILLAGDAAKARFDTAHADLIAEAFAAMPAPLGLARAGLIEARVHAWPHGVSALPGGNPVLDCAKRHRPAIDSDPRLFLVGDYLFDSTLNGVFDSADYAASALLTDLRRRQYEAAITREGASAADGHAVPNDYFDEYASDTTYTESFEEYFCENWTCDLIEAVWGLKRDYKLLDCGSANGLTLERFQRRGVEAWGIENNAFIHSQTPVAWRHRNLQGDVCALPFPDNSFDIVYETCLCYLPPELIDRAIKELFRVCRVGVYCGSISTDMVRELIEEEDLLYGVKTFATMLEWAEHYQRGGFKLAIGDPAIVKRIWEIEVASNEGYYTWYPTPDVMRNCFFSKPDVPVRMLTPQPPLRSEAALRPLSRS